MPGLASCHAFTFLYYAVICPIVSDEKDDYEFAGHEIVVSLLDLFEWVESGVVPMLGELILPSSNAGKNEALYLSDCRFFMSFEITCHSGYQRSLRFGKSVARAVSTADLLHQLQRYCQLNKKGPLRVAKRVIGLSLGGPLVVLICRVRHIQCSEGRSESPA